MNASQIIRAAIPGADVDTVDHVLWARTPFPVAKIDAKMLYRAASGLQRASAKGHRLCDFCERVADCSLCARCTRQLKN